MFRFLYLLKIMNQNNPYFKLKVPLFFFVFYFEDLHIFVQVIKPVDL